MGAEAALVKLVSRTNPVDRRDKAAVLGGLLGRTILHDQFCAGTTTVAIHTSRQDGEHGLDGLGPVHASADNDCEPVVIPQNPGARLRRGLPCEQRCGDGKQRDDRALAHECAPYLHRAGAVVFRSVPGSRVEEPASIHDE